MRGPMPPSHQCRVVLPELTSAVMCAAVITVFGDNLNAQSFKVSNTLIASVVTESPRSLKAAPRVAGACFHPG